MGVAVGASIIVLGTLIYIIVIKNIYDNSDSKNNFQTDFPTWRGISIFILYVWVLGFNLYFF
jgi:hypothetical protein